MGADGDIGFAVLIGLIGAIAALRGSSKKTEEETASAEPAKSSESVEKKKPKPAPTPSAEPTASAAPTPVAAKTDKPTPPAGKKLLPEHGWLIVHGPTPDTRVMVAGKMRGEPEQVLMTPCGKLYVALARVDKKEHWRGWAAKGGPATIPCDGSVGEVTLTPMP